MSEEENNIEPTEEAQSQEQSTRYDFVLDKYRAEGRSEDEALALQAKSYNDLQSRFGSFTGAPDDYEASLSDELIEAGVQLIDDDPLLESAKAMAKEMNMSQDGFNRLVGMYAEMQLAEQKAMQDMRDQEMKSLGAQGMQRIESINKWIDANMDAETAEGLRGLVQSAAGVKAVEQLIAKTRSAPVAQPDAAPAPSVTAQEVQAMQFATDENGNRKINTDPEFKREYERKRDMLYGNQEHRVMVGG